MAELPKLARERLRHPGATEHPDANLLSGFAEYTLTEQERAPVLDHLSRCAQCREIVALSIPEVQQEVQVAAAAVPRRPEVAARSWWRSPIVHWGALTATALVVLIAVGERMRLREPHSASAPAIAKYEPAPPTTAATEATPGPPPPRQSEKRPQAPSTPRSAETSNRPKAMDAGTAGGLTRASKMATPGGVSASGVAEVGTPPSPPPATLPMKPHANADTDNSYRHSENAFEYDQVKPSPSATARDRVGVAAAAPAPQNEATVLSPGRSAGMLAKRFSVTPRWDISDSGALQRSFDGGRSWKNVAVADGVTFRAVSVVANDVWVGGSGGALFHSVDRGEHWTRVQVQTDSRGLRGDIVSIEFADATNGVVSTSTREIWRTLDAGATWRLQ